MHQASLFRRKDGNGEVIRIRFIPSTDNA